MTSEEADKLVDSLGFWPHGKQKEVLRRLAKAGDWVLQEDLSALVDSNRESINVQLHWVRDKLKRQGYTIRRQSAYKLERHP